MSKETLLICCEHAAPAPGLHGLTQSNPADRDRLMFLEGEVSVPHVVVVVGGPMACSGEPHPGLRIGNQQLRAPADGPGNNLRAVAPSVPLAAGNIPRVCLPGLCGTML